MFSSESAPTKEAKDSATKQRHRRRYEDTEVIKVSNDVIEKLQRTILENDPTEFIPADIRNILFCGASRSGKSTIFRVLQNPCYCPKQVTIFAETKFTNFKTFSLRDKQEGKVHNFVINLIDTPGTFEVRANQEEFKKRSNDEISELIIDCINHEVTYVNLLCLVLKATKFSESEMDSIDLFLELFGKSKIPILLCLTYADNLSKQRRTDIEVELTQHPRLEGYFADNIFKICWMGCVNHVEQDYTDEEVMRSKFQQVANWRDDLIDHIFDAERKVDLKDTDIYAKKKKKCFECLDQVTNSMSNLASIAQKEELTGGEELELLRHREVMSTLHKYSFYLEADRSKENRNLLNNKPMISITLSMFL